MPDICLCCQVHQPYRLRDFTVFDLGFGSDYFDDVECRATLREVAQQCYEPVNSLLIEIIRWFEGRFKIAYIISGVLLEQLFLWEPGVLQSFQDLAATGCVELLGETYFHSLSSLADLSEFEDQVRMHTKAVQDWFNQTPSVFGNTELIYYDKLTPIIRKLGFDAALVEGTELGLGGSCPNHVYRAASSPDLKLIPRNHQISDDLRCRFSARDWSGWPLTADKYVEWIRGCPGDCVTIFLDYETFGIRHRTETGIVEFLRHFPAEAIRRDLRFVLPSELVSRRPKARLPFPHPVSWADCNNDISAWLGNRMQQAAHRDLYALRKHVLESRDAATIHNWQKLTSSDYFRAISTTPLGDEFDRAHTSPYDAFIRLMNVLEDMKAARFRYKNRGLAESGEQKAEGGGRRA